MDVRAITRNLHQPTRCSRSNEHRHTINHGSCAIAFVHLYANVTSFGSESVRIEEGTTRSVRKVSRAALPLNTSGEVAAGHRLA